jgi:hypothetical protein
VGRSSGVTAAAVVVAVATEWEMAWEMAAVA